MFYLDIADVTNDRHFSIKQYQKQVEEVKEAKKSLFKVYNSPKSCFHVTFNVVDCGLNPFCLSLSRHRSARIVMFLLLLNSNRSLTISDLKTLE